MAAIDLTERTLGFPVYSARAGECAEPEAELNGTSMCPASANNLLLLDPPRPLQIPGWRTVRAKPRWNCFAQVPIWRCHDASWQRRREHRFWGARHHLRVWFAPEGDHAIGQAHHEHWQGLLRRRHTVRSLDAGRDVVVEAFRHHPGEPEITWADVPSRDTDGRVAVVRFRP